MAFPDKNYAPPGPYAQTKYENPLAVALDNVKLPVFIGEGNEILTQTDLELVRGSSATVDQRVVSEDETGRAVVSISSTGVVTRGDFDGSRARLQVRNYPIVSGDGTGVTTNKRSDVSVMVNGQPVVVKSVTGANGVIELTTEPKATDQVLVTYYFDRTDTLTTDDVSAQVDPGSAIVNATSGLNDVDSDTGGTDVINLHGDILGPTGEVVVPANNILNLVVDGVAHTVTMPAKTDYTMIQVANTITALGVESLVGSSFIDNYGHSALRLTADHSIEVRDGSANALLGIETGQADLRVRTFYTYEGPIVDGTNGGVTTTDPAHVVVKVNGIQVIPESVNGSTRAVTLPLSPAAGDQVKVTYYFNSWQDTFDYLAHVNVTDITLCGVAPGVSTYTEGADFVLKDDKIVWGAASLVSAGYTAAGSTPLDENQITPVLIDNRTFLDTCTAVTGSTTQFVLPQSPTLGNGRDTPLGTSLFQSVSNNRIGLPVNRPDVITAYWGYGAQDALDKGPVDVLKVEGNVITLGETVPAGATVYATFWYNTLADNTYTLTVGLPGASGTGTYFVTNSLGETILSPTYSTASKGAGLAGVTVDFPSGSELKPDLRFEGVSGMTGPVEEVATVTFAAQAATPAKYAVPGNGPYTFIQGYSSSAGFTSLNGSAVTVDLADPTGLGNGYEAHLVSNEITYDTATSYTLATDESFTVFIDGVEISTTVPAGAGKTIAHFAASLNESANGYSSTAAGGGAGTGTTLKLHTGHPGYSIDDYYVGWNVVLGNGATMGTAGEVRAITDYNGTTHFATLASSYTLVGFAKATVNLATVAVGNTVSINGQAYLAVVGAPGAANEFTVGGTDILTAVNLAGAIVAVGAPAFSGAAVGGQPQVTVTATAAGLAGEAVTLATNAPTKFTFTDPEAVATATLKISYLGDNYRAFNPATMAQIKGATRFNGPIDLTNGFDKLVLHYTGDSSGPSGAITLTLTGQVYNTVNDLRDEINTQMATALALLGAPFAGLDIICTADGDSRLVFQLQLPGSDTAGNLSFVNTATADVDNLAILAGFDVAAVGGDNTHLHAGDVARAYQVTVSGVNEHDLLILRNRIMPGAVSMAPEAMLDQTQLLIGGGIGNAKAGFSTGDYGVAGVDATVRPATLVARPGFGGGVSAANGEPTVTFYDGTGAVGKNNVFSFTFDGVPVTVTFTALPGGQVTTLGVSTLLNSVIDKIAEAMGAIPGTPWGNKAAVLAANLVRAEGAGIRLTSALTSPSSSLVIGTGSANTVLGFTAGATASRTQVSVRSLASALNSDRYNAALSTHLNSFALSGVATEFAQQAVAKPIVDASNREYLFIQSTPAAAGGYGSGSIITLSSSSWLRVDTGVLALANAGAQGEAALDGFFVVSNATKGSGSANTSVLNGGVGQDGVVGQTYRDAVTGLTFTILPRGYSTNPSGPWIHYPTGGTATLRFDVRQTFTANANIPNSALSGVELLVANTSGTVAQDTALVETFNPSGGEPTVGDVYYVSYEYTKADFTTKFYSKLSDVESAFGSADPDSPVSLATYLAMVNGAVIVGIKQVQKEAGSNYASVDSYITAVEELEGVLPGYIQPDIITPLRGDSTELYLMLSRSNDIQSSIRYRAERTSIIGVSGGTTPDAVKAMAGQLHSQRMRLVYPDVALLTTEDALGNTKEHLVDGPMLAAALVGSIVSPNVDVATPWTGRKLSGFTQLARTLDAVTQNQIAVNGVTILEDRPPFLRVRQGFTTDMSNILTKTPTVCLIADEVQRQSRAVLEKFIGNKFLPGVLTQIEGRLSMLLKNLVAAQIIAAYTGVKANVSPDDPTAAEVEAFYQPVFPLLYILCTFNLRSSL